MSGFALSHRRPVVLALTLCALLLLAACSGLPDPGPVLVEDITLVPTVLTTPQLDTPTPQDTPSTATPTITVVVEDTEEPTVVDASPTPTLPPTKSETPTSTFTPTATATPTMTWTPSGPFPTATLPTFVPNANVPPPTLPAVPGQSGIGEVPGFPNSGQSGLGQTPVFGQSGPPVVIAGTPVASVNTGGNCLYFWFFSSRGLPYCPAGPPQTAQGVMQEYENGLMFWFSADRSIYVLYLDAQTPRWERYQDTWQDGMTERDPNITAPFNLWQPRRGFGEVWRNNPTVRQRLGWAITEWENLYDGIFQMAGPDGGAAVFFTGPDNRAYQLDGNQTQWQVFTP